MELSSSVSSGNVFSDATGSSNTSEITFVYPDPAVASYLARLDSETRASAYFPNEAYMRYLHAYWAQTGHLDYRISYDGYSYYLDAYTLFDHDYYIMSRSSSGWTIEPDRSFYETSVIYGSSSGYDPVPQTVDRQLSPLILVGASVLIGIMLMTLMRRRL